MILGGVLRYDLLRANALKIAIAGMFGIVRWFLFFAAVIGVTAAAFLKN